MGFLNNMMNKVAMNKLKHESELAALSATCQISSNEFSAVYSCEDAASQCFYSSIQVSV